MIYEINLLRFFYVFFLYHLLFCLFYFVYVEMIEASVFFFFFKQKTAYEMRISDWSSDVCSSDLAVRKGGPEARRQCATAVHHHRPRARHATGAETLRRALSSAPAGPDRHARTDCGGRTGICGRL